MPGDIAVRAEKISKKFSQRLKHVMLYGIQDIARLTAGFPSNSATLRCGEFWAIKDISFEVKKGETLGIVGPNGSGKSTLLKMLNGIFMPDMGSIEITGSVGALIEIGAGFHPLLTGRENVYINGSILGMSRNEIDKKFDEIVEFAGIRDFIDSPVKHYSSGMYVRLGFSIAVHSEPDILLVDEVLAVGDIAFRSKCLKKIDEFKKEKKSIIIVSHDLMLMKQLCDRIIWIDKGVIEYDGFPSRAIDIYLEKFAEKQINSLYEKMSLQEIGNRGSKEITLSNVRLFNTNNMETSVFKVGEDITVKADFSASKKINRPIFGGIIHSEDSVYLGGFNSIAENMIDEADGPGEVEYQLGGVFLPGNYLLTLAVHDETGKIIYDFHDRSYPFVIKADSGSMPFSGYVKIPCSWKYRKNN